METKQTLYKKYRSAEISEKEYINGLNLLEQGEK